MHPTLRRLLATPTAAGARALLTTGAPTGLTGLLTHPSPRTQLLYLYSATLAKLRTLPASSAYRRATEALTSHRRSIVEATTPAGLDAWRQRAAPILAQHPALFTDARPRRGRAERFVRAEVNGETYVLERWVPDRGDKSREWGGREPAEPLEGPATQEERPLTELAQPPDEGMDEVAEAWEAEPKLDAGQIAEIEEKIGAGLIEEVIEVAEGELKLVDTMIESKAWEELAEKAPPGQWEYFARDRHTSAPE